MQTFIIIINTLAFVGYLFLCFGLFIVTKSLVTRQLNNILNESEKKLLMVGKFTIIYGLTLITPLTIYCLLDKQFITQLLINF